MTECKWCHNEFCVNDECPMCADYCPVPDTPNVCKHEKRKIDWNAIRQLDNELLLNFKKALKNLLEMLDGGDTNEQKENQTH